MIRHKLYESSRDPGELLMQCAEDGSVDALVILRECISAMSTDDLDHVVRMLDLDSMDESYNHALESRIRRLERALKR